MLPPPTVGEIVAKHSRSTLPLGPTSCGNRPVRRANLQLLPSALPGIDIVTFDGYALVSQIVANPALFGLRNATAACVTPFVPPFACQRPDDFFYWDGAHPTKAGHAIIAGYVAAALAK